MMMEAGRARAQFSKYPSEDGHAGKVTARSSRCNQAREVGVGSLWYSEAGRARAQFSERPSEDGHAGRVAARSSRCNQTREAVLQVACLHVGGIRAHPSDQ